MRILMYFNEFKKTTKSLNPLFIKLLRFLKFIQIQGFCPHFGHI